MLRSSFCSAALWGSLAVLAAAGNASAQWFPFSSGNACNCGPRPSLFGSAPIMQSASYSSYGAAYPIHQTAMAGDAVQCGQPIACTIDPPVVAPVVHTQARAIVPVQTVRVEPLQTVIQPVMQQVQVHEMRPVKQTVQRQVVETNYVDQPTTIMTPVTIQRTANVPTTDYQTVTEYRKVQKQAGYWVTKTEATGKVAPCQYDGRPGFTGWMNRTGYQMRTAFTPQNRVSRQFVPQTMTCTVPCTKKVAVAGMKQVTYNVTQMQPTQTTRKVAVQSLRTVNEEVTVMQAFPVTRTVQVGHRISYQPVASGSSATASGPTPLSGPTANAPSNNGAIGLQPTPADADQKASAQKPDPNRQAKDVDSGFPQGSNDNRPKNAIQTETAEITVPTRPAPKTATVVRVSQWVAANPKSPLPDSSSSAMSIAGNVR